MPPAQPVVPGRPVIPCLPQFVDPQKGAESEEVFQGPDDPSLQSLRVRRSYDLEGVGWPS